MTEIVHGNFSFKEPPFEDGDFVHGCNCIQLQPGTEICKTVKDLTIVGGNFINCKPQPGWIISGGNWAQISFCSHQHPEWIEHGLSVCAEDCGHRQGSEKQWVEVEEDEYREQKNSLSPDKPNVRVEKSVDRDSVTVQRFQKEVFVYKDAMSYPSVKRSVSRG